MNFNCEKNKCIKFILLFTFGPSKQNLNSEISTYKNIPNDTQTFIYSTNKLIYIYQLWEKKTSN